MFIRSGVFFFFFCLPVFFHRLHFALRYLKNPLDQFTPSQVNKIIEIASRYTSLQTLQSEMDDLCSIGRGRLEHVDHSTASGHRDCFVSQPSHNTIILIKNMLYEVNNTKLSWNESSLIETKYQFRNYTAGSCVTWTLQKV